MDLSLLHLGSFISNVSVHFPNLHGYILFLTGFYFSNDVICYFISLLPFLLCLLLFSSSCHSVIVMILY